MKRPHALMFLVAIATYLGSLSLVQGQSGINEAPTGFSLVDNGFAAEFCRNQAVLSPSPSALSPAIPEDECSYDTALEEFTGPEDAAAGLGPVFNMAGCGECHFTPILGGFSHITEKRAGLFANGVFTEHPGGSLIQDRAEPISLQEQALPANTNVIASRGSLNILGDGFVEAIDSNTLAAIANDQPAAMRGQIIQVPVLERPGNSRTGRFGWKNQQASLLSFSADAYVNEMGITSPMQPDENTSNGRSVAAFDVAPAGNPSAPDDEGVDVALFALFMRATLAPPRDPARAATQNARDGSNLFNSIGCNTCHTPSIVTAPPRTFINGNGLRVANALGNKRIRPFGDFLLHDIGTGDGIVQNGGAATRNKIRTAPLWGLRARGRFMHDSASFSIGDAIRRHAGQADSVRRSFDGLSNTNKNKIIDFLMSL